MDFDITTIEHPYDKNAISVEFMIDETTIKINYLYKDGQRDLAKKLVNAANRLVRIGPNDEDSIYSLLEDCGL
jgi:hypothetical protein